MSELSREAREALKRGLRLDGPSTERRARVKARLTLALASGTAALGGSAAGAELASHVAGGMSGAAKGLVLGSLLAWFGAGAAVGVGVSGVVAIAEHVGARRVEPKPSPRAPRAIGAGPQTAAILPPRSVPVSLPAPTEPVRGPALAADKLPLAKALSGNAPSLANAPSVANATPSLIEEAALLGQAERALAANEPNRALESLAEHERRFPEGALREERQAARVLALCELGRTEDARALARRFVTHSPGSVLVPRLRRSCAAPL